MVATGEATPPFTVHDGDFVFEFDVTVIIIVVVSWHFGDAITRIFMYSQS